MIERTHALITRMNPFVLGQPLVFRFRPSPVSFVGYLVDVLVVFEAEVTMGFNLIPPANRFISSVEAIKPSRMVSGWVAAKEVKESPVIPEQVWERIFNGTVPYFEETEDPEIMELLMGVIRRECQDQRKFFNNYYIYPIPEVIWDERSVRSEVPLPEKHALSDDL